MKNILLIDDDVDICLLLSKLINAGGYKTTIAHSGKKAVECIKKENFDLVISDFRLGDMDAMEILQKIKEFGQDIPVIIITGYSDIKIAVNVIKMGAFDYVTKPLFPDEILHTIKKALEHKPENLKSSNSAKIKTSGLSNVNDGFVITDSKESKELFRQIDLVAPTNYSVIIFGESGTGKESVAQNIHARSARKDKPFIAIDCGALSKELAGSELFGHEKGAFTGALTTREGNFELANGGTIFLDEVSNLSYDIQVSLLRVVQERKLKKIGGTKEMDLDVRIIVASNENLYEACKKGNFREDLYHRFNEFNITIPPLREREKDIMIFANHFLNKVKKDLCKDINGFNQEVQEAFLTYPWPGNLREMQNVVKRAALLTDGELVQAKSLPFEIINNTKINFNAAVNNISSTENNNTAPSLKNIGLEAEFSTIVSVLKQVNFNKTKAAKILNIDRKTLYNKMKAVNIV
jgi:two-component system response regulator HydG